MAKRSARRNDPAEIAASVFKATCLELMDEVAKTGRELVVTKHGRPVVRVSPASLEAASPRGYLRNTIVRHGDIVSSDSTGWEPSRTDPLHHRNGA